MVRLRPKISVQPGRYHYAFSNKYLKTVIFHEKNICIYVTIKQFTIIIYVAYHCYIKYIEYKKEERSMTKKVVDSKKNCF